MSALSIQKIVGLPLSVVRRAADLLNLQFGEITRDGGRAWGLYALHIQAPWRLVRQSKLLLGKSDYWNPSGEVEDWDQWYEFPHPSLEDEFWREFIGGIEPAAGSFETDSPRFWVRSVHQSAIGDLDIEFSDGYHLQVFCCGIDNEFWRLLEPGRGTDHYVVGTGE